MRRRWVLGVMAVLALSLGPAGRTAAAATAEEAKAMVWKAVEYAKANGRDQALVTFSNPQSGYSQGELYLFVFDSTGKLLVNPHSPRLVGRNMLASRDRNGKYFVKELLTAGPDGKWVDYQWINPVTRTLEDKTSFIVKAGDLSLGCGVYKAGAAAQPPTPRKP